MPENPVLKLSERQSSETLASWLLQQGLDGASQLDIVQGYCQHLVDLGVPLLRLHVAQRAFHPQFGGLGLDWHRSGGVSHEHYQHSDSPVARWLVSPLYHLLKHDQKEMRERMNVAGYHSQFPMLNDLKANGATEYYATGLLFEKPNPDRAIDPNNTPEGILVSWTSDGPDGFSDADMDLIRSVHPYLGLALKSASNRQMAHDLLAIYLGRDAGKRVLSGEFHRGTVKEINAVICYFDLTGFTALTEQTPGDKLIEMLNDYFAVAVRVIQSFGGNVLKFMGDGMLTMFNYPDIKDASAAALDAATMLRVQLFELNKQRAADGLPVTGFTLALHAGDILYGNVGAENRLDFTVIGPAVNLTARLSGMHRSIGRDIIVSEQIYAASRDGPHDLVSLGRYMLRGVADPHELYTVHEEKNPA